MAEMNEIVRLAVDAYHGKLSEDMGRCGDK